jgi:hypothetical protein
VEYSCPELGKIRAVDEREGSALLISAPEIDRSLEFGVPEAKRERSGAVIKCNGY